MSSAPEIYLHREFTSIVEAVSLKLTPTLQMFDTNITGVHYQFGHPLEIINTLSQFENGKTTKFNKYPIVCFFLDSKKTKNNPLNAGMQRVHLAIVRESADANGNDTANDRDIKNFIPVLTPIYLELLTQIKLRADLFTGIFNEQSLSHEVTYRYYWGKSGLFGNEANIFNDRVDAIEIENLELTINLNYCPKTYV